MNKKEMGEWRRLYICGLKTFLRISKPWKKRYDIEGEYAWGWNACIKEMKKNGDKFIKYMEEEFKK